MHLFCQTLPKLIFSARELALRNVLLHVEHSMLSDYWCEWRGADRVGEPRAGAHANVCNSHLPCRDPQWQPRRILVFVFLHVNVRWHHTGQRVGDPSQVVEVSVNPSVASPASV